MAKKLREAQLGIAIGRKGVGKTYATLEMIQHYLVGNAKTGAKPRKVLILDVNNEFVDVKADVNPQFQHIKAMHLRDVAKFTRSPKIEARRISILKPEGGKMNLAELQVALDHILANYQNGLLLIEDINKFISDSLPNDLMGSIATQRHFSCDVITHFQTIGKCAHPKLWGNCNWLRFHKCDDTVQRHKDKFAGNIDHLKIAEQMVNNEYNAGNKHFYVYLDKDKGKLKGQFSKAQFVSGVEGYLENNYSIVEKEVKRKELRSGNKIHDSHADAVDYLIKKYTENYYGN